MRFRKTVPPVTPPRRPTQEQEPASPEITEMSPGILRSQLPISLPGLGHVNCYFLEGERGVAVIDPGMPGPASWRALVHRLKQAGYRPRHVHTVVVTHSHPDHFGGAGRLRDVYGSEVITHRSFRTWFDPADDEALPTPAGEAPSVGPWDHALPWRDGITFRPPMPRRVNIGLYRLALKRFMRTPAPTRRVDDAEVITLGRRPWVSLHTPGHTNDHLCLFDPVAGIVLSGDHVLPTITPHISGLVAGADPLSEFFASLDKVAALHGVQLVLPAHGQAFQNLAGRANDIRAHHQERLDRLRTAAEELGDASVEAYSHELFKPRSWGQLAESETYAHLEHLRITGEMVSHHQAGALHYRLIETR